jgi:hypothetical protein
MDRAIPLVVIAATMKNPGAARQSEESGFALSSNRS